MINILRYQILASTIHSKNINAQYKENQKFKVYCFIWDKTFTLPHEVYSDSDIQDYYNYINKKYDSLTNNLWFKSISPKLK